MREGTRHRLTIGLGLLFSAALLVASGDSVRSQAVGVAPSFGRVELSVGFLPDPTNVSVTAGGRAEGVSTGGLGLVDAASGNVCGSFYITDEPSLRLDLAASGRGSGFRFLRMYVDVPAGSTVDPALLVRMPDGGWRCRDDSHIDGYVGLMPVLDFIDPPAGTYEVWVGAYDRGVAEPATFTVTAYRAHVPSVGGED